jgi:hypothetical protein
MLAKMMKLVCIAALLLMALLWRYAPNYQLPLNLVLCVGSLVVLTQAVRPREYFWAAGFLVIAAVFNPILLVLKPSGDLSLMVVALCIPAFAMSLAALKPPLLLSIPSITDSNPGSRSL